MSVATAGALVLIAVSSLVLFSAAAVTSSTYEQVTRPLVTDGASAEAPPRWIEARRSSR